MSILVFAAAGATFNEKKAKAANSIKAAAQKRDRDNVYI
jgi:hypothetical protein